MYVSCRGDGVSEPTFDKGFHIYLTWRIIKMFFELVFKGMKRDVLEHIEAQYKAS